MDPNDFLTEFERGQASMRARAVADLDSSGNMTAKDRIGVLPLLSGMPRGAQIDARKKQRMEDYGPFPETVGTLSVEAVLHTADYYDARSPGGVSPAATIIYSLLRRLADMEGHGNG